MTVTNTVWEMLGKPALTTIQSHFADFNNTVTKCQGTFLTKVRFGDQDMYCEFHVSYTTKRKENVILGRPWMKQTTCNINYVDNTCTL